MSKTYNIIIVGTGSVFREEYDSINKKIFHVMEVWDNDDSKKGKIIDGNEIKKPHSGLENIDYYIVLVGKTKSHQIFSQLLDLGIPEEKIRISGFSINYVCMTGMKEIRNRLNGKKRKNWIMYAKTV